MACQLNCVVRSGVLSAVVSGRCTGPRSGFDAAWIGRAILEQASSQAIRRVLIDVRRLGDRLGSLGELALSAAVPAPGYRVAVLDTAEHDSYYALHEATARRRGIELRGFSDSREAASWLLAA